MRQDGRILDDLARVAGGAINILSGLRQQAKEDIRSRIDDLAVRMDLVPREDMERAEAMISSLTARVEALEKKSVKPPAKRAPGPVKKRKA